MEMQEKSGALVRIIVWRLSQQASELNSMIMLPLAESFPNAELTLLDTIHPRMLVFIFKLLCAC
jgi:hypothetical protein